MFTDGRTASIHNPEMLMQFGQKCTCQ